MPNNCDRDNPQILGFNLQYRILGRVDAQGSRQGNVRYFRQAVTAASLTKRFNGSRRKDNHNSSLDLRVIPESAKMEIACGRLPSFIGPPSIHTLLFAS